MDQQPCGLIDWPPDRRIYNAHRLLPSFILVISASDRRRRLGLVFCGRLGGLDGLLGRRGDIGSILCFRVLLLRVDGLRGILLAYLLGIGLLGLALLGGGLVVCLNKLDEVSGQCPQWIDAFERKVQV